MLSKALEEMFTWLRGLYLVMLFLPALLTAPLCISLGYKRASWVKVRLLHASPSLMPGRSCCGWQPC